MAKLLDGEKVLLPTFNFITGKKEYKKNASKYSFKGESKNEAINEDEELCEYNIETDVIKKLQTTQNWAI